MDHKINDSRIEGPRYPDDQSRKILVGDRLIIEGVAYRIGFHPHGREWLTLTGEEVGDGG